MIWACPCGSGYPLQVLAALRAFRYYPSRSKASIYQLRYWLIIIYLKPQLT
ncbi:MAG: hypothetical protein ACRYFA_15030 [Janthinobacterium lividum]